MIAVVLKKVLDLRHLKVALTGIACLSTYVLPCEALTVANHLGAEADVELGVRSIWACSVRIAHNREADVVLSEDQINGMKRAIAENPKGICVWFWAEGGRFRSLPAHESITYGYSSQIVITTQPDLERFLTETHVLSWKDDFYKRSGFGGIR